jgi:outer membrane protein assembly factor BamB
MACSSTGEAKSEVAPFGASCTDGGAARCNKVGNCVQPSPSDVLTHHNDNARTGLQAHETVLNVGNVNATHFGKAFTIPVDDDVFAQPLYVGNQDFGGASHDALYVATMGDSVYAFDAGTGTTLWRATLLQPGSQPLSSPFMLPYQAACTTIKGNIGALATPAIDLAAGPHGTLYEVAETVDSHSAPHFHLHALDLSSGAERPGSPVAIENIKVDGQGVGGDGKGHVLFDPVFLFSRLSLLIANGRVYLGFSSICDQGPFHGWLLAYDEQTLALASVFNATPDTSAAGIWQGGDGPAADEAGNIYVVTGNGPFNVATGGRDYGDSILRLTPSLGVLDYFTPHDAATLWQDDLDLGSAGVLIVPGTRLLAHISKTDTLRLVDGANMGKYGPEGDPQIPQSLELGPIPTPAASAQQHQGQSNPVAWSVAGSVMVYFQTWQDPLRQYQLTGGQLKLVAMSDDTSMPYYPGAGLSVSANGSVAGTGIVWALTGWKLQQGTLMAFDASDVSHPLWMSPATDDWLYVVHTKATVANGRVYVPTASHEIVVYASRP